MPVIQNHPLRLRRLRAGLSQAQVAEAAGVSRAAVAQLEEGRITRPNEKIVRVLAERTQTPAAQIMEEVARWDSRRFPDLSNRAMNALALPAAVVSQYDSFQQWRGDLAENITQFSSITGVSRNTLAAYEDGTSRSMPKPLITALYNRLHLDDEYVEAVQSLPRKTKKGAK